MSHKQALTTLEKKIGSSKAPKPKKPVSPKRFIESSKYMNAKGILYPEIRKSLNELILGGFSEAVLTGGIGCGKTTLALYCMAYQLYLLSCMEVVAASKRLRRMRMSSSRCFKAAAKARSSR